MNKKIYQCKLAKVSDSITDKPILKFPNGMVKKGDTCTILFIRKNKERFVKIYKIKDKKKCLYRIVQTDLNNEKLVYVDPYLCRFYIISKGIFVAIVRNGKKLKIKTEKRTIKL